VDRVGCADRAQVDRTGPPLGAAAHVREQEDRRADGVMAAPPGGDVERPTSGDQGAAVEPVLHYGLASVGRRESDVVPTDLLGAS
jgi:hypothetical protein